MNITKYVLFKTLATNAGLPEPEAGQLGIVGTLLPEDKQALGIMVVQSRAQALAAQATPTPEGSTSLSGYFSGGAAQPVEPAEPAEPADGDPEKAIGALRAELAEAQRNLEACKKENERLTALLEKGQGEQPAPPPPAAPAGKRGG